MSKKAYYKCEGCGISFSEKHLKINNDLELTCDECVEEAKKDKRVRNLILISCAFMAGGIIAIAYKYAF